MDRKRALDAQHVSPPKRTRPRATTGDADRSSPRPDVDALVMALAQGETGCAPAYSSSSNLIALVAPPSPTGAVLEHAFPTFFPPLDTALQPPTVEGTNSGLDITLAHFSSPLSSIVPRISTRLTIPSSPPLPYIHAPAEPSRITYLSWSPDGEQLLAVSSSPAEGDTLTLFEHQSACLDEAWEVVLQEKVARYAPGPGQEKKRVLSVRWVGEARRWYPAPTFPDAAREASKKPLFCAPARSAPLSGSAFVAVLSSDEILFLHLPRSVPLLPRVLCMPLSPSLSSTSASSSDGLTRTAIPTPPTPLPSSSIFALSSLPNGLVGAEASPQATVDALVTSLVANTSASSLANAGLGLDLTQTPSASAGAQALRDELAAAAGAAGGAGGKEGRGRRVSKAAIGACRSRGTAEAGETWFVVARWIRREEEEVFPVKEKEKEKEKERAAGEAAPAEQATTEHPPPVPGAMDLDDPEFALLADFTSLDEAFGSSAAPAAPPPPPANPSPPPAATEDEEDQGWDEWAKEAQKAKREREKWRVELTEVRVEMAPPPGSGAGDDGGPRLSIRPQPPLFLSPSPAHLPSPSFAPSIEDPLLTHLTFLGDVSLPHPLSALSSSSPSLLSDGSEPAVDLCLLAVLAHSSPSPSEKGKKRWRSTLTSYQLSHSPTGYALSEAFHSLEGRRLDAPNTVEGAGVDWAGREAACEGVGKEGVVSAVEIRPGGGEWASFVAAVVKEGEGAGERGVETKLVAMSSVTLQPLNTPALKQPNGMECDGEPNGVGEKGAENEEEHILPGSHLYHSFAMSPNGGLCALPFSQTASSSPQSVIAAGPLGCSSDPLTTRLSLRLCSALARQASTSDLSGRIATLPPADAQKVFDHAAEALGVMLGGEDKLEGTALGWELLGVMAGVYRAISPLERLSLRANALLTLSTLVRSFAKAAAPIRGVPSAKGVYRCEEDAIWPLTGAVGWFCRDGLPALFSSSAGEGKDCDEGRLDEAFPLLHPLTLHLLSSALEYILSFRDFLIASSALAQAGAAGAEESETVELAKVVVGDACALAAGGRGLEEVRRQVERVRAEVGASSTTSFSPPLLISLTLPASLAPQATAACTIFRDAFGPSFFSSPFPALSFPTPSSSPASLEPQDEGWDVVRRARLIPGQTSSSLSPYTGRAEKERQCLRCGRRTRALENGAEGRGAGGGLVGGLESRWRRYEEEWEGRCLCGGHWVRYKGV
ncbi:hypothetical protein JCM8547_005489 [Rhodosporidiobolus lusitaniae]